MTNALAGPHFSIIWADKEHWNGPLATTIRVRLADSTFADYRRDPQGHWWAITNPMTAKQSETPWNHRPATPRPICTQHYGELDRITVGLLGDAGRIARLNNHGHAIL